MRIGRRALAMTLCLTVPGSLLADVSYQETTKITGGSIVSLMKFAGAFSKQARQVGEPVVNTVYVKGNRMARVTPDHIEIVDLDKETVTQVDKIKHTYYTMTFEQMKQQIERSIEEAKKQQAQEAAKNPQAAQQDQNVEASFDVHVRNTGATKQVSGLDTSESILTMTVQGKDKTTGQQGGLAITNDMWLAPEVPQYDEVREFNRKFALKMGKVFSGALPPALLAQQPNSGQAMSDLVKEMGKLKGVPVLQVMRIGVTQNGQALPAASEAALAPSSSGGNGVLVPIAGTVAQQAATSAIANKLGVGGIGALGSNIGALGGTLGGLGGFGHKKKPKTDDTAAAGNGTAAAQTDGSGSGSGTGNGAGTAAGAGNGTAGATGAGTGAGANAAASVLIESSTELGNLSSSSVDPAVFGVPAGYTQVQPDLTKQ